MSALDDLVSLVATLRGPAGCPWDRAQTPATMRPYLLEEAYEVVEAIDGGEPGALQAELGDLLFQIVLIAQMAQEAGRFSIQDVALGIHHKMVRRHPHVFVPGHVEADAGSVSAWEARKAMERPAGSSALDGVPNALPALIRAHRVGEKAARVGFDWPDVGGVREKVDEELGELDAALAGGDPAEIVDEYGDALLALANLGRALGLSPEDALRGASAKFEGRFRLMEALAEARGAPLQTLDAEALDALWREAKALSAATPNKGA